MSTTSPFSEFLTSLATLQEDVRKATAWVEAKADPETPGLTAYRITGASRAVVQGAIDARMWKIEEAGGTAEFRHPVQRIDGTWLSTGYTRRFDVLAADAGEGEI